MNTNRQWNRGRSRRETQLMENGKKNCQNVSKINNIPAPATNIREQLAALKTQVSYFKKPTKLNKCHLNTKMKVLKPKKVIETVNKKFPRKLLPKGNKSLSSIT